MELCFDVIFYSKLGKGSSDTGHQMFMWAAGSPPASELFVM